MAGRIRAVIVAAWWDAEAQPSLVITDAHRVVFVVVDLTKSDAHSAEYGHESSSFFQESLVLLV